MDEFTGRVLLPPFLATRFVSYSANAEDVMLRRLFSNRRTGVFVDVGAAEPIVGNDTYGLYLNGWRGVNIEPNPGHFAALQAERPDDANLDMALADHEGEIAFHEVSGTGLSTCSEAQAEEHRRNGYDVRTYGVRVSTLARVLDEAGVGSRFDLLKIDVEGFEEKVLRGNDWHRFRPDIVLVEATLPNRPERRQDGIHDFMRAHGYRHLYFDGLNDFYGDNSFDPEDAFRTPPNVFDGFIPVELANAREQLETAIAYATSLETELARSKGDFAAQLHDAETSLATARSSAHDRTREAGVLLDLSARLLRAPGIGTAELAALALPAANRNGDPAAMDELPAAPQISDLASTLLTARGAALEDEVRELQHQLDDLTHENRRLRASAEQMRGEILSLNRALEPMHAVVETFNAIRARDAEEHAQAIRAAQENHAALHAERAATAALREALQRERVRAESLEQWISAVSSSGCWKLTGPYRVVMRQLRSVLGAR